MLTTKSPCRVILTSHFPPVPLPWHLKISALCSRHPESDPQPPEISLAHSFLHWTPSSASSRILHVDEITPKPLNLERSFFPACFVPGGWRKHGARFMASDSFICSPLTCQVRLFPSAQSPLRSDTLAPGTISLPQDLGNYLLQLIWAGCQYRVVMKGTMHAARWLMSVNSIILHLHNAEWPPYPGPFWFLVWNINKYIYNKHFE